ncbi:MAG: hypothetical protein ACP5N1_04765 [Candidatus Woesearchaeota archaeon]
MTESRFLTRYSLRSSVDKLFNIIGNIATEPFSIEFQQKGKNQKLSYIPPDSIIVSDNLFRQYNCLDYSCSKCCWKLRDWNIFTKEQYSNLPSSHKEFAKELPVKINENTYQFYIEDNTNELCNHLKLNSCSIHKQNPLHCALPLIKFKRTKRNNSEITYITREVYTRNWYMQCPVQFKPINEEGLQKTLWVLERVKDMANELQVPTSIDKIITIVENHR